MRHTARNDATGHVCRITGHAMDQWNARCGGTKDDFRDTFRRAMPYGRQLGADMMLEDNGFVFVIGLNKDREWIVRTVLTIAQAAANTQAFVRRVKEKQVNGYERDKERRRNRVRGDGTRSLARFAGTRRRPRTRLDLRGDFEIDCGCG